MKTRSKVLETFAGIYQRSKAGRTGRGTLDFFLEMESLLAKSGCREGQARADAEQDLIDAEHAGILKRIPVNKYDSGHIGKIRFDPACEEALYEAIGQPSPRQEREAVASQFQTASAFPVPAPWEGHWKTWCANMRAAALAGASIDPFARTPSAENQEVLALLAKLLEWKGESLVRFASCQLCGDSKRLEALAASEKEGEFAGQLRGRLGRHLESITGGAIRSLDDLGIAANPRSVLLHGPLRLFMRGQWIDFGALAGAFRVSKIDIDDAGEIFTTAPRCVTIENETMFHELVKLQSGDLLVCTSFPGSATTTLLRRLPESLDYWHFGDTDESGFEILQTLRSKTGKLFRPLHMQTNSKHFEQEFYGSPSSRTFPYFAQASPC